MSLSRIFHAHGFLCASHPWEVIVFTIILTLSFVSMGSTFTGRKKICGWYSSTQNEVNKDVDIVIMTITGCMAVLYIYHQFRNLHKFGSKYILGIAGLFTVFSSIVFSSSVINFLQRNFTELNEALPFFLVFIDLSKASLLAKFALMSSNQKEVRDNIARGMSILGPTISLDTLVETLVIGMGTLAGVRRLEMICCFACLSVVVNYLVFMSFFPACLSLVLELSRDREEGRPAWQLPSLTRVTQEEEQKTNPVVQRVKVIMSAGLLVVHAHSRWPLFVDHSPALEPQTDSTVASLGTPTLHQGSTFFIFSCLSRWLTVTPDQLVMLTLAVALSVKYIFFESNDNNDAHIHVGLSELLQDQDRLGLLHRQESNTSTMSSISRSSTASQTGDTTSSVPPRPVNECLAIFRNKNIEILSDEEIIQLMEANHVRAYQLEEFLKNQIRAISIRRQFIFSAANSSQSNELPYLNYDYANVTGACCENVIGYMPVPLGVAGPLLLDGNTYYVPMATTEGCLVASTNRGCRGLVISGGVHSSVLDVGMTRAPAVQFPSAQRSWEVMLWLKESENFSRVKEHFDSTSRFARLKSLQPQVAGRYLFIRFAATTGDAMGMNMVTKGAEAALKFLKVEFPDMYIHGVSGNYCTDKKAAAVNWIKGRAKSVVCEAIVPSRVVKEFFKTTIQRLIELNHSKNLIGSAMAGSIGGFNAQAANIVTAIFIATGQDPAQNITSANCMTIMEPIGEDLHVSCTMPSIEVGTTGGGTILPAQKACLGLLGIQGPCQDDPSWHACTLARIVCGTVMAGELSLMAALTTGNLVDSHMKYNRAPLLNKPQTIGQVNTSHNCSMFT